MKKEYLQDVKDERLEAYEKYGRIALETARNMVDRPEDEPTVEYVKNKPVRIIEWVKNINHEWIQRQRIVHEKWIPKIGWVDDNGPTEVVQFRDFRQYNRELLPIDAFVDQGTSQPKDPKFPSDKAIQRECVVAGDGKLMAFHLRYSDPVPFWKNPEWLIEKLGCNYELALKCLNIFKHLGFDRKTTIETVNQIIEGEIDLLKLQDLLEELPIVTPGPLTRGVDVNYKKKIISKTPMNSMKALDYLLAADDLESEEEHEPAAAVFGMHALHFEEDGCPHEFLTFLRFASIKEIKGIMKGMFPTVNEWGTKVRAKFWYLTPSQRSQVWQYINNRREELGIYERSVDLTKGRAA